MKIAWRINSSNNSLWACIEIPKNKGIMLTVYLTVYRCIVTGKYSQMVWHEGDKLKTPSRSEHDCCIEAMACSEKAANDLLAKIKEEV